MIRNILRRNLDLYRLLLAQIVQVLLRLITTKVFFNLPFGEYPSRSHCINTDQLAPEFVAQAGGQSKDAGFCRGVGRASGDTKPVVNGRQIYNRLAFATSQQWQGILDDKV